MRLRIRSKEMADPKRKPKREEEDVSFSEQLRRLRLSGNLGTMPKVTAEQADEDAQSLKFEISFSDHSL